MAKKDDKLSAKETAQRRDDAIRRALNTPPKPHAPLGKKRKPMKQKTPQLDAVNSQG